MNDTNDPTNNIVDGPWPNPQTEQEELEWAVTLNRLHYSATLNKERSARLKLQSAQKDWQATTKAREAAFTVLTASERALTEHIQKKGQ